MSTGTVKWFNMQKGYGFIAPENGGADVFVHITAVEKAGFRTLNENEKIAYDLLSEKGKTSAGNLRKENNPHIEKLLKGNLVSFRVLTCF